MQSNVLLTSQEACFSSFKSLRRSPPKNPLTTYNILQRTHQDGWFITEFNERQIQAYFISNILGLSSKAQTHLKDEREESVLAKPLSSLVEPWKRPREATFLRHANLFVRPSSD